MKHQRCVKHWRNYMPIKDKEKNREYQREWARKRGKTKRMNQRGPENRQKKTVSITGLTRTGPYDKLKSEVDKCVPLCANCHRMVHAGIKQLPDLILLPS